MSINTGLWILTLAAALLLIYLLICFILFFKVFLRGDAPPLDEVDLAATHYAAYADEIVEKLRALRGQANEVIRIRTFDGTELAAHYYDRHSPCTAVLLHGYRAPYLNNFAVSGTWLMEQGFNLLIPVQRAHGESGGRFMSLGEFEHRDLACWLEALHERYRPERVVLYGVSMGCNAAIRASETLPEGSVDAMVLDCGYANTFDTVARQLSQMPAFPARLFAHGINLFARLIGRFDMRSGDTREVLKRATIPAFFIHGTADDVVPVEQGRENYLACASPKAAFFAEDAAHATGFMAGGEALRGQLVSFLERFGCMPAKDIKTGRNEK